VLIVRNFIIPHPVRRLLIQKSDKIFFGIPVDVLTVLELVIAFLIAKAPRVVDIASKNTTNPFVTP
jgi:hypothetical protein